MTKQTYEVMINANALRTVKVRASSAREALDMAWDRVARTGGAWTLDLPGANEEHFTVSDAAGKWQGPDSCDEFLDEPSEADDDDDAEGAITGRNLVSVRITDACLHCGHNHGAHANVYGRCHVADCGCGEYKAPVPNAFCTNRSSGGDACGECDGCRLELARIQGRIHG